MIVEKLKKLLKKFLKQGSLVPDVKVTKDFARELNEKCADVHAHEFVDFLMKGQNPFIKTIANLSPSVSSDAPNPEKKFDSTPQKIQQILGEFYDQYMPQKAQEAKQILNVSHPLFVDENGNSTISFVQTDAKDTRQSHVGHSGQQKFLEYAVFLHGNVGDLRTTAHETAHALSSHHQMRVKDPSKVPPNTFENDCVGEIEAFISEKLFNRFLVEKGIYTKKDVENYKLAEQKSLLYERNLILEETDILSSVPAPITQENLKKFVEGLKKEGRQPELLERVDKMHDDKQHSSYMFRYVVGRTVSEVFMDRFEKASKEEQKQMLETYQTYLDHTHELELDDACNFLLGGPFYQIAEEQNKIMESKKQKVFEQDTQRQLPKAQKPKLSTKIKESVFGR